MFEEIKPAVTVICSRCGESVDGLRLPGIATSGFYESSDGKGIWGKYMDVGETIICDRCMHADARYIADYGDRRPK